jgi:hypothetical protein
MQWIRGAQGMGDWGLKGGLGSEDDVRWICGDTINRWQLRN